MPESAMNSPLACTIIANNYLAYARAFTRSFLARHPEGTVCVLIVDRPQPGHRYEDEPFTVVFADQLGIPSFSQVSFRYSILELNTAVKPYFLLHLHRTFGWDHVCYFDPDILVLGDLADLYDRLGRVDAVLTPHLTAPIEDAAVPNEREILLSGIYNLGFLGLSFNERTLPFLDWWARRLYRQCLHEVEHGLFVDQRWMDFAPSFLPNAAILRDPGYNAAYWNLAHRRLAASGDVWRVLANDGSEVPLRFFHFSGYDFRRPDQISKFQNRFTFADRPDVAPLFRLYGERVREEGQETVQDFPYQYGRFGNGVAVPDVARLTLRQVDPEGRRWPDPFATGGEDSFFDWLRRPAGDSPSSIPLCRLALILWDHRQDLQRAFPRPWQEDRHGFAHWFAGSSDGPERIPREFTGAQAQPLPPSRGPAKEDRRIEDLSSVLDTRLAKDATGGRLSPAEIRWLTSDAGHDPSRRPRVPRLALEMYRRRPDLLRSFPDPLGADRQAIALWYATSGRQEYRLPAAVVRPILRTLPWRQRIWARLWWEKQQYRRRTDSPQARSEPVVVLPKSPSGPAGISVIGWATAPTGVGEACRGTLEALAHAGIPWALWTLDGRADGAPGAADETHGQGLPHEPLLFHVNADMMEHIQSRIPRSLHQGRHRIGYWFWELSHFPLYLSAAFRCVDEIWAPSRFCLESFRVTSPVEVHWVPPCVVPTAAEPADREALGVKRDEFLFFFAFDALSVPERKNPGGLLAAFARTARGGGRPVRLLIKVNHAEADLGYVDQLRRRAEGLPVTLVTGTLPREAVNGLTAACDAYVSLHRSEGLGLPLIEAMYLGKPVIATGYGGVTDFLDDETGLVVRHRPLTLEVPHGPYPAGAVWAEPDVEHAAALMRALADAPESAAPRVAAARRRVLEIYSPEAAGERLGVELERIRRIRRDAA
jgi:glycosyltransferase involved in cell wall biosynthesis